MKKCIALCNGVYSGESIYKGKTYLYKEPYAESALYYTLFDMNKVKNNCIHSIYVTRLSFNKDFEKVVEEVNEVNILFNSIMDGI